MKYLRTTVLTWLALWLTAIVLTGCGTRRASDGWITLLENGSGMENFVRVGEANWRKDGDALVADKGGKTSSYLVSREAFTDFVIYAEFWADENANSGIFFRLSDRRDVSATNSYEVNIFDKRPDPSFGTGAILNFAKVSPMPKAGGRWNTFEITARGSQLTVKMNGVQTAATRDRSFFHGPLALQYGTGVVKFRTVRVKPL
jgi:hypothetical protein